MITIDDFATLDIRIGTILEAEKVPDTDKLVRFVIDLGSEKRQIVGGFAQAYPDPSILVGQQVPILVNIAPRAMRGLESQGMVLAASQAGLPVPLHPEKVVENGSPVS